MEIFLYLNFRFYSFVFSNLSLYSVFSYFSFCKRTCDHKKSRECYCHFCSQIYPQIFDNILLFKRLLLMNEILLLSFIIFFQKTSLFSLDICHDYSLSIDSKRAKIFRCTYFRFIQTPNKLIIAF